MDKLTLSWGAIGIFVAVTGYLAYRGYRRTKSFKSFALGAGNISPVIVGLALAAQLTSVATFVVNPGLVFAYGLAGLLGFGVAAAIGIVLGLVLFTHAFRRVGVQVAALSVPQWIGARFESKSLSVGFGVVSLGLVAFAVLIVVAMSYILQVLLGLPAWVLALGIIVFVFSYVALGGVNTHAYTNAIQASIMLLVALLLIGSGVPSLWEGEGLFARLAAANPVLTEATNPQSLYFRNLFEVFVCNFLVGLALVCQPHILSKSLYLKDDKQVRRYLTVAIGAGIVFVMVMWVGLFARMEVAASTRMDLVIPTYIAMHFSDGMQVLISIGILCAGISTLEGILLALSTIVSSDLYLGILGKTLLKDKTDEQKGRSALIVGRLSIVVLGVVTFLLSRWQIVNPTGGSVAIFAQYGVYLLIATSFIPLGAGMFLKNSSRLAVIAGTLVSLAVFFAIALFKLSYMSNNPAFLASMAILSGWAVFVIVQVVIRFRSAATVPGSNSGRPVWAGEGLPGNCGDRSR